MRALCLLGILATSTVIADDEFERPIDEAFSQGRLIIEASELGCHAFDVYLALNRTQQRRGLMFVRELPLFEGMLFVYDRDALLSMWMRNTFIPLDMLFVRADGTVASVARNTEPKSEESVAASEPVRFVLELNAGVTERLHIDAGSRLILPVETIDVR